MGRHIFSSLSLGLLFTCATVSARSNTPVNVLPFKIYGQQLIVVQGSIGPLEKRNLIVDTGAYPTVIDAAVAQKLSLSGHREELDAVDRTVSSMQAAREHKNHNCKWSAPHRVLSVRTGLCQIPCHTTKTAICYCQTLPAFGLAAIDICENGKEIPSYPDQNLYVGATYWDV